MADNKTELPKSFSRITSINFEDKNGDRSSLDFKTFFPPHYFKIVDELPDDPEVGTSYLITGKQTGIVLPSAIHNLRIIEPGTVIYVSNEGSDTFDTNVDEEFYEDYELRLFHNSFRSLQGVFEYINKYCYFTDQSSLTIKTKEGEDFIDDSIYEYPLSSVLVRPQNSRITIKTSNNSTMTLNSLVLDHSDITLEGDFIIEGKISLKYSRLAFSNDSEININITTSTDNIIEVDERSDLILNNSTVHITSSTLVDTFINATNFSMIKSESGASIDFHGQVNIATINVENHSTVILLTPDLTGSVIGIRYILSYFGLLSTKGKGSEYIPGTQPGVINLSLGYYD